MRTIVELVASVIFILTRRKQENLLKTFEDTLNRHRISACAARREIELGVVIPEFYRWNLRVIEDYEKAQEEFGPKISKLRQKLRLPEKTKREEVFYTTMA
jgi:hypothetical protein